jgi:hypothetical protein
MHHTSQNPKHAADMQATSILVTKPPTNPKYGTMEPFSPHPLWHQQLKPNVVPFSTTTRREFRYSLPLKKWVIHTPHKLIIQQQMDLPTNNSANANPKLWTCNSTGYKTESNKKQFHVYSRPGPTNLVDYFVKHHPRCHHHCICSTYLHCLEQTALALRGCVNPVCDLSHAGLPNQNQCMQHDHPKLLVINPTY